MRMLPRRKYQPYHGDIFPFDGKFPQLSAFGPAESVYDIPRFSTARGLLTCGLHCLVRYI